MNVSTVFRPQVTLVSQVSPPPVNPRTPVTNDTSYTSAPNCGVNPPGRPPDAPRNGWWNVKQLGFPVTWPKAPGSGALLTMATAGQLADPLPVAARTSPTSNVAPPSPLNTEPRVFGFRK